MENEEVDILLEDTRPPEELPAWKRYREDDLDILTEGKIALEGGKGLGSYPSIYAMGHSAIKDLLRHEVLVQEKVDGSQFSFGYVTEPEPNPENTFALRFRSKGAQIWEEAPPKMFKKGVEAVRKIHDSLGLHPGWIYRGEYLDSPKHNSLRYERIPVNHVILFDVNTGHQEYLPYEYLIEEGKRLGFEVVPLLYQGYIASPDQFRGFLDQTSVLGGQKIEGVVVKPVGYNLFGLDKKVLMGKFVSESFKEVHSREWGKSNPKGLDIINLIGNNVSGPARWNKSIHRLREQGFITDSPKDIGPLIKEIQADILKEEVDLIKDHLFKWAEPHILRAAIRGFPQWYKDELLKLAFEKGVADVCDQEP